MICAGVFAGVLDALERGADLVVNTDADNQYDARSVPDLVAPILAGRADLVDAVLRLHDLPPLRVFGVLGVAMGLTLAVRYAWFMATGEATSSRSRRGGLLASLFYLAIFAHLLRVNRRMHEEICSRSRSAPVEGRPEGSETGERIHGLPFTAQEAARPAPTRAQP